MTGCRDPLGFFFVAEPSADEGRRTQHRLPWPAPMWCPWAVRTGGRLLRILGSVSPWLTVVTSWRGVRLSIMGYRRAESAAPTVRTRVVSRRHACSIAALEVAAWPSVSPDGCRSRQVRTQSCRYSPSPGRTLRSPSQAFALPLRSSHPVQGGQQRAG
jgi:hypothetical protein